MERAKRTNLFPAPPCPAISSSSCVVADPSSSHRRQPLPSTLTARETANPSSMVCKTLPCSLLHPCESVPSLSCVAADPSSYHCR
ncbi:hypothetical protein S83_008967 [Arachis hypogaea]|nr:uncharacterized protein DS421_3g88750 [Arachis hypogaea]